MSSPLTPEQHEQISDTIASIAAHMGVTYGRAKEACVAALVSLVTPTPEPVLDNPAALLAFKGLKEAGPGAICEDCGHFAARHHNNQRTGPCLFPRDETNLCPCLGMVWLEHRFVMDSRVGPLYIKEKA